MSAAAIWQEQNTRALSAAITWLRAFLQRHAEGDEQEAQAEPVKPGERQTSFKRRRKTYFEAGLAGTGLITSDDDEQPITLAGAPSPEPAIPPPSLVSLRDRLGLTPFE